MYASLLKNVHDIDDFSPAVITNRITNTVQDYFTVLFKNLRELEKDIVNQVKNQQRIKELTTSMSELQGQFVEDELWEKLENEKNIIDEKVDHARYAFIVTRKEYYRSLVREMEELNARVIDKLTGVSTVYADLLTVEYETNFI